MIASYKLWNKIAGNTSSFLIISADEFSSVDEGQNPGFTPLNSFESDVMGITPLDSSSSDYQI